ncbi:hypothetical protein A9Q99_03315 [Gammaproteobacteria bacterium 45_16_T64]|nr:hypothetical protein A9Q99_03315 [Gammaproteobacteria bacterium 45_16_T64]
MVRITVHDVHRALIRIYEQGYRFGQRFVYLRGTPIHDKADESQSGIEEKINYILFDKPNVGANHPTVNSAKVLQEGHHSMVALAYIEMNRLSNTPPIIPHNGGTFLGSEITHFVQIIEGSTAYRFDTRTKLLGQAQHFSNITTLLAMK